MRDGNEIGPDIPDYFVGDEMTTEETNAPLHIFLSQAPRRKSFSPPFPWSDSFVPSSPPAKAFNHPRRPHAAGRGQPLIRLRLAPPYRPPRWLPPRKAGRKWRMREEKTRVAPYKAPGRLGGKKGVGRGRVSLPRVGVAVDRRSLGRRQTFWHPKRRHWLNCPCLRESERSCLGRRENFPTLHCVWP